MIFKIVYYLNYHSFLLASSVFNQNSFDFNVKVKISSKYYRSSSFKCFFNCLKVNSIVELYTQRFFSQEEEYSSFNVEMRNSPLQKYTEFLQSNWKNLALAFPWKSVLIEYYYNIDINKSQNIKLVNECLPYEVNIR